MNTSFRNCLVATLLILLPAATVPAEEELANTTIPVLERDEPVDFESELLPVLRRNCLACHNTTDAESDLVLEDAASISKGGASGPAIDTSDADASLLLQAAAYAAEPLMPPEDNEVGAERLTAEELGLLRLWIAQGAKQGGGTAKEIDWQPLPAGVNPVYAVAVSPDGQYAAAGRANQVFLYHLASKRLLARLTDPALTFENPSGKPGIAHRDLVQSLAFSPDGQMLASGGYRTVKLWRRGGARQLSLGSIAGEPSAVAVSPDGRTIAVGLSEGALQLISGATTTTMRAHSGPITALQYAGQQSNPQLFSASVDGTIRRWNLGDRSVDRLFETPAPVLAMRVLSDGHLLAAGDDGVIRGWQTSAEIEPGNEPSLEFRGHEGAVTSLAVGGEENSRLVSGGRDGTLRVWNLTSGEQTLSVQHSAPVQSVAISGDGERFASAGGKVSLLWDSAGKQVAELKGDFRRQLQVEEAEQIVAVAKREIENAKSDLKEASDRKGAEEKNAKDLAESRDKAAEELKTKEQLLGEKQSQQTAAEQQLASAKQASASAGESKKAADSALATVSETIAAANAALQAAERAMAEANAKLIAAQASQQEAEQAQTKAAEELAATEQDLKKAEETFQSADEAAKKAAAERDAAKKAREAADRAATRADAALQRAAALVEPAEQAVKVAEEHHGQTEVTLNTKKQELAASEPAFQAIHFSPDGMTVSTGSDDGYLRTWDAASGAAISSHRGHRRGVSATTLTAAGQIVTASRDGSIMIWHQQAPWSLDRTIGGDAFADRVTALDFSPDGKLLASGSGEPSRSGQLKIWQVADGSLAQEFPDAHSDTIQSLRFSPDGRLLASSGADRFAKVFDVAAGEFVRAFEGHTHHVLGVSWRADGRLLATSGADNVIKIWDARTGDQKRTITGFNKEVTAVSFLAASDHVVASSGDKSVQIKNTENGRRVRNLSGAADFMYSVAVSANGKAIVAGGQDSVVRVWQQDGKVVASFSP